MSRSASDVVSATTRHRIVRRRLAAIGHDADGLFYQYPTLRLARQATERPGFPRDRRRPCDVLGPVMRLSPISLGAAPTRESACGPIEAMRGAARVSYGALVSRTARVDRRPS